MTDANQIPAAPSETTALPTPEHQRCEAAVGLFMHAMGLPPPSRIEWCEGPLDIIRRRDEARLANEAGPSVLPAFVSDVRSSATRFSAPHTIPWHAVGPVRLHDAVAELVAETEARRGLLHRLKSLTWALAGRRSARPWNSISLAGLSQFDADWLTNEELAASRNPHQRSAAERIRHVRAVVANCGWFVPHHDTCWLCERPTALHLTADRRLHCDSGPALAYRDGWKIYAWKGVRLPAEYIEARHAISVAMIDQIRLPVTRRCLIEIMSPERFVAEGGATPVSRDETGVLWRRRWRNDIWAAVEVRNGSAEPDGSFKTYFLQVPAHVQTPREAVAWTYHIDEARYAKLAIRT